RQFAGESLDQLVFWPLLTDGNGPTDLPLADIGRVEVLLAGPPNDEPWIRALAAQCDGARPTICFTRHRATAHRLRIALGDDTAWITGSAAGIGPHRIPRATILAAFGPDRAAWQIRRAVPRMLMAADVVAVRLARDGCTGAVLLVRERNDAWRADNGAVEALIKRARTASPATIDPVSSTIALTDALRATAAASTMDYCAAPALVSRIHRLARQAAAKRDGHVLQQLDRLLRFATTPPTLGGRTIIAKLQELSDREFVRCDVPDMVPRGAV